MAKKSKKSRKIGKSPAVLWYPVKFFANLFYRLKYGVRVSNAAIKGHKGPAVVLAVHTSGKDHILSGLALPGRPTFVLSEHFYANKKLRPLLEMMRTIPKKMFFPDSRAVRRIIRAVREGNTVVLFPEGRLTWYSRSLEITAGTAELVKHLGVDVFVLTAEGAGRSFPKWSKSGGRRGRIDVRVEKLFDGAALSSLEIKDIDGIIRSAMRHDEEKAEPGVRFRSRDTSAGLDTVLWKCPVCGGVHTLACEKSRIVCQNCGAEASLDEYGRISGLPAGTGIDSVAAFYESCAASVDISKPLALDCSVGATDTDGYLQRDIGRGILTVVREKIEFRGTVEGAETVLSRTSRDVVAFPVTLGDHIDVYFGGRLFIFTPLPDPRDAIVAVAYLDRVTAENNEKRE